MSFSHYWWYHLQRKHSVLRSRVKWLSQAGVCFWACRGCVCPCVCMHVWMEGKSRLHFWCSFYAVNEQEEKSQTDLHTGSPHTCGNTKGTHRMLLGQSRGMRLRSLTHKARGTVYSILTWFTQATDYASAFSEPHCSTSLTHDSGCKQGSYTNGCFCFSEYQYHVLLLAWCNNSVFPEHGNTNCAILMRTVTTVEAYGV